MARTRETSPAPATRTEEPASPAPALEQAAEISPPELGTTPPVELPVSVPADESAKLRAELEAAQAEAKAAREESAALRERNDELVRLRIEWDRAQEKPWESAAKTVPANMGDFLPESAERKLPPGFPTMGPAPEPVPMPADEWAKGTYPELPTPSPDRSMAWKEVEAAIAKGGDRRAIVTAPGTHIGEIEVFVPADAENPVKAAIEAAKQARGIVAFGAQPIVQFPE